MAGTPWYWVRDGSTSVDTEEVIQCALAVSWAQRSASDAVAALVFAHRTDAHLSADSGVAERVRASDLLFAGRRDALTQKLLALREELDGLAQWLSVAALIYASAEGDAASFISACNSLAALDCSLPDSTALGGLLSKAGHYVGAMGRHKLSSSPSVAGLEAQTQFGVFAGGDAGRFDRSPTSGAARFLSGVWELASLITWGKSTGVVVSGGGKSAWGAGSAGALTRVALGERQGSLERWPDGWSEKSHPVSAALAFVATVPLAATADGRTAVPRSAGQLLRVMPTVQDLGGVGEIKILKHVSPGPTRPSWSVVIKGTQTWLPGTSNPQDMQSNLQEVAGELSDQQVAVLTAMDLAGIRPGDPVELVGHSQGGAVALSIAADQGLLSQYNVVSVLTVGAPAAASQSCAANVLALENTADVVPALDGSAASAAEGNAVVYFDDRSLGLEREGFGAHSIETYIAAAERLEEAAKGDPSLGAFKEWSDMRVEALGFGAVGVTTTGTTYLSRRTRGTVRVPEEKGDVR